MQRRKMVLEDGLQRASGWCAGCAAGYMLLSLAFGILARVLMQLWVQGPGAGASRPALEAYAWSSNLFFSLLGLLLPIGAAFLFGRLPLRALRLHRARPHVLVPALLVYLGFAQLGGLLANLVGQVTGSTQQMQLPGTAAARVLAFLAICVVPPIFEECLFRGVMQGFLRPYGHWLAIVGQAVPFALLHGSASAVVFALLAGLFFGWLAERTDSILPGMVLHFVNNTMAFVQLLLLDMGADSLVKTMGVFNLIALPLLGGAVLVWWCRQGGHLNRLERVRRVDRLLYARPWLVTQLVLVVYCLLMG